MDPRVLFNIWGIETILDWIGEYLFLSLIASLHFNQETHIFE